MLPGALAVFVSGAAVMVAELVSARLTAPFYGQSSATWAALAGVTLLGVTLGNWLGGKAADRVRRPLFVAAAGALGGAVLLAVVPLALPALAAFAGPDNFGLFLFAMAAFLPPTAFLGAVSPSVAAAFVRAESNGRDLGVLYFSSMVGSMLGSAATGLYLPFVLPTDGICRLSASALAAVGLALAALARKRIVTVGGEARRDGAGAASPADDVCLLPVFLVGFACMATELALARLVTPVLGGSHIVWSSVFMTFIGMMGVGGYLGGKAADAVRRDVPARWLFVALGVALYATVLFETRVLGLWTMGYSTATRIVLHVFVGFAPYALVLGFLSAFFMQRATRRALVAGDKSSIGLVYAVGGVGSSCGSFFAGMLFTSSASALAALPGATRPLPAEIATDGANQVVFRGESSYNSVTVTNRRNDPRQVTIWLDRIPHTSCDVNAPYFLSASYTRLLDVAAEAFGPGERAARAFVIGGGGYALPRKWSRQPERFAEIAVAEIDPLVSRCAHRFMDAPADGGRVRDHIADGRRLAEDMIRRGETNRFDLVVGDTIGDAAIPYHLTTREFFAEIRGGLLTADGVYLMHVLDVLDDPGLLSSVFFTLKGVFPHVCAVSYAGVRDVRQSFVVAASSRALDPKRLARELVRQYPEALPLVLGEDWKPAVEPVLLTDAFAPVERFVWRVMDRDVQYRSYALAQRMRKADAGGDAAGAYGLAKRVLAMQPEQTDALGVVEAQAASGNREAEETLRAQAERPSIREEAKVRYAALLMRTGRGKDALPLWREIVRRWPENDEYRKALESLKGK